jgi:metal-responsive CopG/Arc/MetJ family transcriptional regulator
MRSSFVLGISLPKQLVKQMDAQRGDIPRSRYLLRILQNVLEYSNSKQHKIIKNIDQDRIDHDAVESEVVNLSTST